MTWLLVVVTIGWRIEVGKYPDQLQCEAAGAYFVAGVTNKPASYTCVPVVSP